MLTTAPRAFASIGSTAWVSATGPMTLTSNCRRSACAGIASSGPSTMIPGHVDETCKAGGAGNARDVASRGLDGRRLLEIEPHRFHAAGSVWDCATRAGSRAAAMTLRPSVASRSTSALPIPAVAPVTKIHAVSGLGCITNLASLAASQRADNMSVPSGFGNSLS